jgi:hypothetical protein
MRKRVWIGMSAAIALALSVSFAAQSPSQSSSSNLTVTGCLQRADQAPTGTSGTPSASDTTKFILTNVTPSSSSSSATGTSGTAGASSTAASTYRLDADESKLSPHVGHKVTISGTPEPASASSSTPSSSSSSANAPKLKVDSVTMVSATCP